MGGHLHVTFAIGITQWKQMILYQRSVTTILFFEIKSFSKEYQGIKH